MRPTTDLLTLDYVFSQRIPLTSRKFIEEVKKRILVSQLSLSDWEQLEELHRVGALVPLFRFEKNTRPLLARARRRKIPANFEPLGRDVSFAMNWNERKEIGRLVDPRTEAYKTWYSYMRSYDQSYLFSDNPTKQNETGTFWASSFLYSYYQLLLVPTLRSLLPEMRRYRREQKFPSLWKYKLSLDTDQREKVLKKVAEIEELSIALTVLEAKYLPNLRGHRFFAHFIGDENFIEGLLDYQRSFNPLTVLNWLDWDADRVENTAKELLYDADRIDPLKDWYELIRMCDPKMQDKLRGDALIALDYRRAAEILLCFYEDLQDCGAAPPFAEVPTLVRGPYDKRLEYDQSALDKVLMEFGLSPQPALVLIIEGQTEEYIIPHVMELLNIPQYPSFIQVFNIKGIDKDFELLARYIVPFQLGETQKDFILLTRPPTHFLVAVDAERKFKDSKQHEKLLTTWVDGIFKGVSKESQTESMKENLSYLVHIETWGDVFEFAHFTDLELAEALHAIYLGSKRPSVDYLQSAVERERQREDRNISHVLGAWDAFQKKDDAEYKGWSIGKVALAVELWPVLEMKIRESLRINDEQIPIVKILLKAQEIAISAQSGNIVEV